MVEWLRLQAFTAGGMGLKPGWGTKIPHAQWGSQKKKSGSCLLDDNFQTFWDFLVIFRVFCLLNIKIIKEMVYVDCKFQRGKN